MQNSWAGGWARAERSSFCDDAPGSGSSKRFGPRQRAGEPPVMLEALLSQACLASGTPVCCPCSTCALLASALSHLLGAGRGRKSAPCSWIMRRGPGRSLWGDPGMKGIAWSLLEAQGCLSILFMVLDSSGVYFSLETPPSILGHQ